MEMNSTSCEPVRILPPNGEEIQQEWNIVFVVLAYSLSFVASYAAVHLLDHTLWRSKEEQQVQIIKHPRMWCSIILGFGSVWSMHFVGMGVVTLQDGILQCYDWPITLGSMAVAIIFIFIGLKVASNDIFAGPDRLDNLKTTLLSNRDVTHKKRSAVAIRTIQRTVLFHKIHHIVAGGIIAVIGPIVMHYTGMIAVYGPFRMEWNIPYLVISVMLGVVICVVGFWILFRLRWKANQFWLRYVSAGMLAVAVSFLHFFGMLSVTYIADDTLERKCYGDVQIPGHWTAHQQLVVVVTLVVPLIATLVENLINQELLRAYRIKADPDFAKLFGSSDSKSDLLQQQQQQRKNSPAQGRVRISGLYDSSTVDLGSSSSLMQTTGASIQVEGKKKDVLLSEPRPSQQQTPLPPINEVLQETSTISTINEVDCNSCCEEGKQNFHPRYKHFSMVGAVGKMTFPPEEMYMEEGGFALAEEETKGEFVAAPAAPPPPPPQETHLSLIEEVPRETSLFP